MAFDEDFHLGIIRLYASHISPFWIHQPGGANTYGAVARDPSYLYQYVMSFPYRLITLFTHKQSVIVIFLRIINIALFANGLYLFKRLLTRTGASLAKINFTLLVFILIPVVPLLAAQINYDNLFFLLTAAVLILTIDLADYLFKKKVDVSLLVFVISLCLLASLVKYAFLPIAAIVGLYIIFEVLKNLGVKPFIKYLVQDWQRLTTLRKVVLVLPLIISIGLFYQRYGVNVIKYHTPIPDCSKVLTINQCKQYGPWIRDYNFKINRIDTEIGTEKNVLTFTADWFYGMWLRTFYSLSGPGDDYQSRGPLPIPSLSATFFAAIGIIAALAAYKKVLKNTNAHHVLFLTLVAVFYTIALYLDEYRAFADTGQPVAINGRYIFPVILPVILILVVGLAVLIRNSRLRTALAVLCIVGLCWGGGVLTFILRSNDYWYWNSSIVRSANHGVQQIIGPVTPGNGNPALYLK